MVEKATEMRQLAGTRGPVRASEAERASIRALKNWLLATPSENPLEDQLVRLRLAAAIANLARDAGKAKGRGPEA